MSHGRTKIASKGACIYCKKTDVRLTDEHIVPLSLGGQHIILEASCDACADITKKFEQDVARELWGDARTSYDAPSRRKRQRKTHIVLRDPDNPQRSLKVPYTEYPAPIVFYKMTRAGLLEGMPETIDLSSKWLLEMLSDQAKNLEFERKYGMKLTARFRHVPESFARLIAKIGYGQVLCSLDPGDFRTICVPFILGQKKNPSFVVGGAPVTEPPDAGMGYVLRTMGFGTVDRLMLMAKVRLFSDNFSPNYHVVVGDITGRDRIAVAVAKLGDIEISLMGGVAAGKEPSKQPHWTPGCWPLPFWRT